MNAIFKKSLSVIITGALLLNSTVVYAEENVEASSTVTIVGEDDGITSDELLLGYFETKLFGDRGISLFGRKAYDSLGTGGKALYTVLLEGAKKVASGESDSTLINITSDIAFDDSEIDVGAENPFTTTFSAVHRALLYDNPYEFYWYQKSAGVGLSSSHNATNGTNYILESGSYVYFTVATDYGLTSSSVTDVDTTKTKAAATAAAGIQAIVDEVKNSGKSDAERLEAYKDKICELVAYDHDAAEASQKAQEAGGYVPQISPWQLINVFDGDSSTKVVCEGYSKAFQYLCDLDGGLTCYSVTGTMSGGTGSGGHMWNIVTLNGTNYLVDVTNCDEGTIGNPNELFLKAMTPGADTSTYSRAIDGQSTITYVYDSNTTSLFESSELLLSSEDYSGAEYTVPTAKTGLVYTGEAQELVNDGTITDDDFLYMIENVDADYSAVLPTATNAGDYTVLYKAQNDNTISGSINVSIAKATPEVTGPTAVANLSYTGSAQALVTAGSTTGGEMQYSLDGTSYSTAIPTGTDAKTYTVYYKVVGGTNYEDVAAASVDVTIAEAIPGVTPPTAIANLEYTGSAQALISAGSATGGEMQYSLDGTSYSTAIPTGTDAKTYTVYYKVVGGANYEDVAAASINVTIAKADSSVTGEPTAVTTQYTGSPIALIDEAGTATGGTIQYSLEENGTYSADIPTGTDAKTYTVYYKVVGDANHNDSEVYSVSAVINSAEIIVTNPTGKTGLAYTGSEQALITAGACSVGGTLMYALGDGEFSTEIPTATNAGDYIVKYKVVTDNDNYFYPMSGAVVSIEVSIAKADVSITTAPTLKTGLIYTGSEQVLITEGAVNVGEIQYKLGDGSYSTELPTGLNAGDYTVYYKVDDAANYNGVAETALGTVSISKVSFDKLTVSGLDTEYVVTGSAIEPTFEVKFGEITLVKDTDYTVDYADNVELNSVASITITLSGNYTGTIGKSFTIVSHKHNYSFTASGATITAVCSGEGVCEAVNKSITISAPTGDIIYSNAAVPAAITGSIDGVTTPEIEYDTADGSAPINAGTYTASVTLGDATASVAYEIKKAVPAVTAPTGNTNLVYNKAAQALISAGSTTGGEMQYSLDGTSYSTAIPTGTDAKTYTVWYKVVGGINYEDVAAASIDVEIDKAIPTVTAPMGIENLVYTGSAQALITAGSTTGGEMLYSLEENGTYTADIPTGTDAKTYTVWYTVEGGNNYETAAATSISVEIGTALAAATVSPEGKTLSYTGEAQALVTDGTAKGGVFMYSVDGGEYSETIPTAAEVGEYTITYYIKSNDSNYKDNNTINTVTAKINKARPTFTIPGGLKATYGDTLEKVSLTDGFVWNDPVTTSVGNAGINTFMATFTPADTNNYEIVTDVEISIEVAKAVPAATAPKAIENLIYEAGAQALITAGSTTGGEMQYSLDGTSYSAAIPTATDAGEYTVYYKVVGGINYEDIAAETIKVTIGKASPAIPAPPTASEITYGDTLSKSVLSSENWLWADETVVPAVNNSGFMAYLTVDDKNYDYSDVDNYNENEHRLEETIVVSVKAADISVKADDKYIIVGAELPVPTYTVTGLVNGDTLKTEPTLGYSGADNMTIGEYDIIFKTEAVASENYNPVKHTVGKLYVGLCDHEGTTKVLYDTDSHWYKCTKCGADNLSKEEHKGGTATCTEQAVCEVCNIPYGKALGHSWSTEWSMNETHHWHNCPSCTTLSDANKDGYSEHSYGDWVVVTPATETADGVERSACVCGMYKVRAIPATGSTTEATTTTAPESPVVTDDSSSSTTTTAYTGPIYTGNPSGPVTTTTVKNTTTTTTTSKVTTTTVIEDEEEEADTTEPQIMGDNGKMGWDAISDEIADADDGDTITIDMNGATELPKNILKEIKGKDIEIVLVMDDDFTWTINGKDVTSPKTIDLGIRKNADIPVSVINKVSGEKSNITISIAHDGKFGFKATLGVKLGKDNKYLFANLYYYNEDTNKPEFVCADKINSKGVAELEFTHASDYIIVIDEEDHGKTVVETETEDSNVNGEIVNTPEDDDPNPFTGVAISFTGVIVSAAAAFLTRKRKNK